MSRPARAWRVLVPPAPGLRTKHTSSRLADRTFVHRRAPIHFDRRTASPRNGVGIDSPPPASQSFTMQRAWPAYRAGISPAWPPVKEPGVRVFDSWLLHQAFSRSSPSTATTRAILMRGKHQRVRSLLETFKPAFPLSASAATTVRFRRSGWKSAHLAFLPKTIGALISLSRLSTR